ncbi:hypothetical protein [Rhodococcoides fascians]|uniref:hypothetical protein n=1 Tax=Rhodococcoides fascians TaxID=1828 RepID=UPI00050CB246|nr:hypothetical protein [Rhodococcus fascians]
MVRNPDKTTISNGVDRVALFYDGRIKISSRQHDWALDEPFRHNALGESVRVRPDHDLGFTNPPLQETPHITISLDPDAGDIVADTVVADNGTFVEFRHDGSIVVGNDGRELLKTFNTVRTTPEGGISAQGGAVMIRFAGSYRPKPTRTTRFPLVTVPERKSPIDDRPYPGEDVILQNQIDRTAEHHNPTRWW